MRNCRYRIYLFRSSSFCPTMPLCLGSQTTQTLTNIFTGSLLTKEASPDTETATGSFEMIRQSGLRSSTLQPAVIYTLASCPLERTRALFCWKRYSNILLSLDLGFLRKKIFSFYYKYFYFIFKFKSYNQRMYIRDRRDSPDSTGHRLTMMWLTQPLPALSAILQLPDRLTEQAGRGWVSHIFVFRWPVLSLLSLIYILWSSPTNASKCFNLQSSYFPGAFNSGPAFLRTFYSHFTRFCTLSVHIPTK